MDSLPSEPPRGTILLVSGDLDKPLTAFEIGTAQAAMGMDVSMWFVFYGVNCLTKPRGRLLWRRARFPARASAPGRNVQTDTVLQYALTALNYATTSTLPLSRLNFWGGGAWLLRRIMRRKGVASLETLIRAAEQLNVAFRYVRCVWTSWHWTWTTT